MKEQVLVFKADQLAKLNYEFEGFRKIEDKDYEFIDNFLLSDKLFYMDRDTAETDPTHLQLIPYCLIQHKGKIFSYKRTKKGGEKRLHELYSIGVGGHINPIDGESGHNTYQNGLFRELKEEIDLTCYHHINFYGFIRDTSTPVNSVHFGVVHIVDIHDPEPKWHINDKALSNGGFETVETLKKNIDSFESWSKLIINSL